MYAINYKTNKLNTMIHSFYVENFLSIRDRQEISFATTADKTVRDLVAVEVKPNVYITSKVFSMVPMHRVSRMYSLH